MFNYTKDNINLLSSICVCCYHFKANFAYLII